MYIIQSFLIITVYLFVLSIICNGLSKVNSTNNNAKDDLQIVTDDSKLNITQLGNKYGYNIETHKATTEDGYILSLHRIEGRVSKRNSIVVFLMHGILDSSDSWILQGPNNALAYGLADEGYDVWMGNARGNKYSSTHASLSNTSSDFWKFSWEEMALYDIPTMIDYTLNTTANQKLYYVGHSQGTTTFFAMLALKPEYNAKVNMMFALAPVTWISNAKSPIFKLFTTAYKIYEFFTSNQYSLNVDSFSSIPKFLCNVVTVQCENILQWIIGKDYKFINADLISVIYAHVLSSSSVLQFIHYGQLFESGRFCRFDYGAKENLIKYGTSSPPDYDIYKVTVPVVLFYSGNDWLSDSQDVAELFAKLPNVYDSYSIDRFNHVDYMYANIAKELIYSNIMKNIQEFESNMNII